MRIGYCSPFNPMKSGISDFSEELVFALSAQIEIVIFSPIYPTNQKILEQFEVHKLSELENEAMLKSFDLLIYHIGNNEVCHGAIFDSLLKHPGVVELHEIGLHNLMAKHILEDRGKEAYLELAHYCHGIRGVAAANAFFVGQTGSPWNEHGLELCMARPVIEAATAIIVHSDMVKQMVLGIRPDVPIINILHHSMDIIENVRGLRLNSRKKLHFSVGEIIFGMFGYVTQSKRILQILDSLHQFNENCDIDYKFVIVGEVLDSLQIEEAIKQRALGQRVIVTGYTSLELFKTYMGACDFCINLRYPTQGENSGSLHRMFGMGIPAIVTDIGTFADFPDDIVIKVRYDSHEIDDICAAIRLLATNKAELKRRSEAALQFAKKNCDIDNNAIRYRDFFQQVTEHTWQPDYEDVLISHLCELGLTADDYSEHIWNTVHDML